MSRTILQLSRPAKVELVSGCAASLTMTIYIFREIDSPDMFYASGKASIYGCEFGYFLGFLSSRLKCYRSIETNMGIVSGCMTCLPSFYQKSYFQIWWLSILKFLRSKKKSSSSKSPSETQIVIPDRHQGNLRSDSKTRGRFIETLVFSKVTFSTLTRSDRDCEAHRGNNQSSELISVDEPNRSSR